MESLHFLHITGNESDPGKYLEILLSSPVENQLTAVNLIFFIFLH